MGHCSITADPTNVSLFILSFSKFFFFPDNPKKCINNHTIISACLNIADAWCPTGCRATGALRESDVRSWKQPKTRRWSLSAAPVLCLTTLSANSSVSQGQSGAWRILFWALFNGRDQSEEHELNSEHKIKMETFGELHILLLHVYEWS